MSKGACSGYCNSDDVPKGKAGYGHINHMYGYCEKCELWRGGTFCPCCGGRMKTHAKYKNELEVKRC